MYEDHYLDEAEAFYTPFDDIGIDFEEQTGADWMRVMLAASMGGKVVEGVSLSGSSEVIFKTTFEKANEVAVGRIKYQDRPKSVESVDLAGTMVAKSTAKFRGVGKASTFGLAMEDTLWSSTSVSRVRDAAFLAASLVAMGAKTVDALGMTSDILGEELPEDIMSCVVTPLSLAKRDAATTVKNRSSVFLPQYALQPVVWDDTPLQGRLIEDSIAIDWGRVTGVAKYIGAINSLIDPKFKMLAESVGVPYRLVQGHSATISGTPYRIADTWAGVGRVLSPFGSAVSNASDIAESVEKSIRLTVADMQAFETGNTITAMLKAMTAARKRVTNKATVLTPGTDKLAVVTKVAFTPAQAAAATLGTDSAFNAVLGASTDLAGRTVGATDKLAKVIDLYAETSPDEGEAMMIIKRAAEVVITGPVFLDAAARLARRIGSETVARNRISRLRRSLFANSSALADTVTVRVSDCQRLAPLVRRVAKAVVLGNTGMCLPPAILANPEAALQAHAALQLINEANEYLALAKEYWANRYDVKSKKYVDTDRPRSIKLAAASKAFKTIRPEWLLAWNDDFLPPGDLDKSYIVGSARNYTRKRSEDISTVKPAPGETAMMYAKRIDDLYAPNVPFTSVVEFVTSKVRMLAEDFSVNKVFKQPVEEVIQEPPAEESPFANLRTSDGLTVEEAFAEMEAFFRAPDPEKTWEDVARTWTGNGDYEEAARDNGYDTFVAAFKALKLNCAFDTENSFTRKYFLEAGKRARDAAVAGDFNVI